MAAYFGLMVAFFSKLALARGCACGGRAGRRVWIFSRGSEFRAGEIPFALGLSFWLMDGLSGECVRENSDFWNFCKFEEKVCNFLHKFQGKLISGMPRGKMNLYDFLLKV